MNEWWLIGLLLVITIFASALIIYPLRTNLKFCLIVTPLIFFLVFTGYYFWGAFPAWQQYIHHDNSQKLAQQMLKTIKTPEELISKLRAKLDDSPESAKGWYLLGRIYTSQNDNKNAVRSFAKAYHLNPQDQQFAVNYAHSLWLKNHKQFTPKIIKIFQTLLNINPKQPDALAMLAMNAFLSHAYEDAINYWQRLLELTPNQSEEALAIRKAIAKAQDRIVNSGRKENDG